MNIPNQFRETMERAGLLRGSKVIVGKRICFRLKEAAPEDVVYYFGTITAIAIGLAASIADDWEEDNKYRCVINVYVTVPCFITEDFGEDIDCLQYDNGWHVLTDDSSEEIEIEFQP